MFVKCSNCGKENKNTNIRCEFCNAELNIPKSNENFESKSKKIERIVNIVLLLALLPGFLLGILFTGVSIYSTVTDISKSKKYLETEGKLVNYENCQYESDGNELCNAIYEYTVNNTTYKGSPKLLTSRSEFKETVKVKYNSNNPSEYLIDAGWNTLLIAGIIIIVATSTTFILFKKDIKVSFERINELKKL